MAPETMHECPRYCHPCPDMSGGIMPYCTGQATRGDFWDDMWACTCPENDALFEYVRFLPGDDVPKPVTSA